MISGFRHGANDIYILLQFYAVKNGSFLMTFRDNPSVPSTRLKQSSRIRLGMLDPWRWERQVVPIRREQTTTQRCVNLRTAQISVSIDRAHHSAAEHRDSTTILHLILFSESVLISTQVFLTHWGRVTQICVFTLQLCKTG